MFKRILPLILLLPLLAHASVTVVVNGSNHTIPQTNEKGWGANVTAWIQAISQYTLQPSGGTFTLTADTDFGATYGLKSAYFKTRTSTPATAGILRLANSDTFGWRNNANSNNLLLSVDSSDRLLFNGSIVPALAGSSFTDSGFYLVDDGDATKKIQFQASGIATATTRTITVPDANVDLGALAPKASPTFTGTVTTPVTASRLLVTGASSELAASAVTATEAGYLAGVSSAIQTQMNLKAPAASPTFTGTVTTPVTASRALVTGASSELTAATTTATEIGYVNGVTSAIQTQLDAKQLRSTLTTKGDIYAATASNTVARVGIGSDGQVLTADAASTPGLKWATPATAPDHPNDIQNCSLAGAVASNALTISLKDASGADPSGGSPCKIGFRSATAATGTYTIVSTTGAVSVVVSNGSALGCTASVSCVLYVYAINNAGTVVLAVVGGTSFDEGTVQSSTAEGGSGGADTVGVLYSTASQSSKAVRLLGRMTITPGASFAWSAGPTEISNVPFNLPSITNWVAFTPTGSWSTNCTFTGFWRRLGDTMEVQSKIALTGAPTSAVLTINIPSGYTIDTTKLASSSANISKLGVGGGKSGGTGVQFIVGYNSTTSVDVRYQSTTTATSTAVTQAAPNTFANSDEVNITYQVPIVGWGI